MGVLSWVNQTITTTNSWGRMAVDPVNGIAMTMGLSTGGRRSADGGVTWTVLDNVGGLPSINSFNDVGFGGGTWLIGVAQNNIYRSTDGGLTWAQATTQPNFNNNNLPSFVFSPTLGSGQGMWMAFCMDTVHGVMQFATSTDGGKNWSTAGSVTGSGGNAGTGSTRYSAWDGTNFIIGCRDSGNNNTCLFTSSNAGSSWSQTTLGSIFAAAGDVKCVNFINGVYTLGFGSKPLIRQGTTFASLTSGGTDFSSTLLGCTSIGAIAASPSGQMIAVLGQTNTTSDPNALEQANPPTGTFVADTSPQASNCYAYGCIYDTKHGVFIATGAGPTGIAMNSAFGEVPAVNLNTTAVTIPAGSGSFQFVASLQVPPTGTIVWSVNGIVNGNTTVGTINNGFYVAPAVPVPGGVVVTASRPFLSASATATITHSAAIAPPGFTVTPEQNYTAPAGIGGDRWGAAGGGITPVGVSKPVIATVSNAQRQTNYRPVAPTVAPQPGSLDEQFAKGALSLQTIDNDIGHGGTTQG